MSLLVGLISCYLLFSFFLPQPYKQYPWSSLILVAFTETEKNSNLNN